MNTNKDNTNYVRTQGNYIKLISNYQFIRSTFNNEDMEAIIYTIVSVFFCPNYL